MALRFIDSFSHYTHNANTGLGQLFTKWTTPDSEAAIFPGGSVVAGSGRCLQNALQVQRFSGTTKGSGPCKLIQSGLTEGVFGVGVKYPPAGIDADQGFSVFVVKSGGVLAGNKQLEMGINSDGTLRVFTIDGSNNPVELGRTATSINADTWHFVELVFKIHSSAGVAQIWVDNVKRLDLSGINTTSFSNGNTWSVAQLGYIYNGSGASSGFLTFSDFYCGDAQTDRKGDSRVFARLPTGAGTYSDFTPNPVVPHWQNVDENPPDGNTTVNFSSTPGQRDTYTFPQIGIPSGTVYAVQVLPMLKKDDVGTRSAAPVIVQGGITYDGVSQPLSDGDYIYYSQIYELDPTGASWSVTNASNDEFGVKITG